MQCTLSGLVTSHFGQGLGFNSYDAPRRVFLESSSGFPAGSLIKRPDALIDPANAQLNTWG